jgi:hypothetical protein
VNTPADIEIAALEKLIQRMEQAANRAERAAEQMSRFAGQRPGVAAPLLSLCSNEMTTKEAGNWIGRDQQTIRNWLHDNPCLGKFRDDRWIVFRDELANYFRRRFPDAAAGKFGV